MPLRMATTSTNRLWLVHCLICRICNKTLLTLWPKVNYVFDQRLVRRVRGPFIRQNPRHTHLAGDEDEVHLTFFRRMTAQSDDERFLASECPDERLRLSVVDRLAEDAFGQLELAVAPRDGRDGVFAGLEKGFGYDAAAVAAGLGSFC